MYKEGMWRVKSGTMYIRNGKVIGRVKSRTFFEDIEITIGKYILDDIDKSRSTLSSIE